MIYVARAENDEILSSLEDQTITFTFPEAIRRKYATTETPLVCAHVRIVVIRGRTIGVPYREYIAVSICGFACHELGRILAESFNFKLVLI